MAAGILVSGRSDLDLEEDSVNVNSYPYGALRVKDLIQDWRKQQVDVDDLPFLFISKHISYLYSDMVYLLSILFDDLVFLL